MSTFSGLNTGLSSLYAQRRGLELTGHNIANANTEGYSRQRLRLEADGGPLTPALHSRWNGTGGGVKSADVQRLRDVFLEARGLEQRGSEASLRSGATLLSRVESMLVEPGEAGLQAQLAEFWSGWDDVANRPGDLAARSQLLERAQTLATGLNQGSARMDAQWKGSHEQLRGTLEEINATAVNVAELNREISTAMKANLSPNDLMDQRDVLVQRLGEMAGVTSRPGEFGEVTVYLGGTALVRGAVSERLGVVGAGSLAEVRGAPPAVAGRPAGVVWERDGNLAAVTGGNVDGLLRGMNDVLPRYQAQLDSVAQTLIAKVNEVHRGGVDQSDPALTGQDFFVGTGSGSIALSFTDPARIAAALPGTGPQDGGNALRLAELSGAADGADAKYRKLIVTLGVESQTANRRLDIQTEITREIDAAREAEAGVNLDEEMTTMLAYQRGYEGAARFMTAVDQVLDTLINRTGLVGR